MNSHAPQSELQIRSWRLRFESRWQNLTHFSITSLTCSPNLNESGYNLYVNLTQKVKLKMIHQLFGSKKCIQMKQQQFPMKQNATQTKLMIKFIDCESCKLGGS